MTPRPILKTRSSSDCFPPPSAALPFKFLHSPHVHFPPTPILTDTQITHSSFAYDRAPIVVSPNTCELPERGGRVYDNEVSSAPKGCYFHPRAFEACEPEPLDPPAPLEPPPLIPDLSSESEDSDTYVSPPESLAMHYTSPTAIRDSLYPISPKDTGVAFSFLPYPHSPVKSRPKLRRTGSKLPPTRNESFGELSLDGCLGGF